MSFIAMIYLSMGDITVIYCITMSDIRVIYHGMRDIVV